jgi:hypothetical protein
VKFTTNVTVDTDEIIWQLDRNLSHEQLMKFILDVDKIVADCNFTEDLIVKLIKVMKKEYKGSPDLEKFHIKIKNSL